MKLKIKGKDVPTTQIPLDNDWRDIQGFPHYKINRHGQVKRISDVIIDSNGIPFNRKGRILSTRKNSSGYVQVDMCEKGIAYGRFVHVLLARAFIPNPNNLPLVNHIDENPSNNILSNLEWCDYSHNAKHSINKIINAHKKEMKAVIRINISTGEETEYMGVRIAAKANQGHHANIIRAITNNSIYKGYKWKYKKIIKNDDYINLCNIDIGVTQVPFHARGIYIEA